MSKYDAQLSQFITQFPSLKNAAILLPTQVTVDKLSSALALMLALKQAGKEATVATQDTMLVSHTTLFGVGEVKNNITQGGDGNFVITLEGVVDMNGQVPALEKLDWYPEGSNLNLVFHVMQGQKFEPTNLTTKTQGDGFDHIFVIGASNVADLGVIYSQNAQLFVNLPVINIDNGATNANFAKVNIVDANASSISEMLTQILPALGLPMDSDIASNILAGIYDETANLTTKTNPETFMAVGMAMQAGAKTPQTQGAPMQTQSLAQAPEATPSSQIITPIESTPVETVAPSPQVIIPPASSFVPASPVGSNLPPFMSTPVNTANPNQALGADQSSQEERPSGEYVTTGSPENPNPAPDWLTPKIFKGTTG